MTSACPIFAPIKRVAVPGFVSCIEKKSNGLTYQISSTELEMKFNKKAGQRIICKEMGINLDRDSLNGRTVNSLEIRMNELYLPNLDTHVLKDFSESFCWEKVSLQTVHIQPFQLKGLLNDFLQYGDNISIPAYSIESENGISWQQTRNFRKHIFKLTCQNLNESQNCPLTVSTLKRKLVLIHEILHNQEVG